MSAPVFLFDFGSPNAYLAWRALGPVEARTGARFVLTPILLGGLFKLTGNQSPATAFAHIPAKSAYQRHEMLRYADRRGLPFKMNPHFPVNTLTLMRGAVAASQMEIFDAYVAVVFHYMWEDPRKLDDPEVLAGCLEAAGLPAKALLEETNDPAVKAGLVAATEDAAKRGVFGAPSFLVGEELFFGKDSLPEVEAEIMRSRDGGA